MMTPEDKVEKIIEDTIKWHSTGTPAMLRRAILEALWEAGYDVTCRPDMIPIRHNPGEDATSPYTAEQEREAQSLKSTDLFQQLADEPRNAPIREKIVEIAQSFGRITPT